MYSHIVVRLAFRGNYAEAEILTTIILKCLYVLIAISQ